MRYARLDESALNVSELCLGTMTYGQQTRPEVARQQLDYAIAQGINFIDTAEMYPLPFRAETQGKSEEIVGHWLAQQQRDRLIIATKITGPNPQLPWIRGRDRNLSRQNIIQAVEASLERLQTDYIDLYQIHWPDRYLPLFGKTVYDPGQERIAVTIADQLLVLADLVQAGKIRYVGLSNETPWGVSEFCRLAQQLDLPKIVSIQNAYSLTNRIFEIHLAETCRRQQVGLLAYSPLAFGYLSGKYQNSEAQDNPSPSKKNTGRIPLFPKFGQRYGQKTNFDAAVQAYLELAQRHNLSGVQMALAFVRSRWFVSSTIIGASTLEQLKENVASLTVELSEDVLQEIDAIHRRYPNPTP